jgi:hypothetical protein
MGKGFQVYQENDPVFEQTILYRFIFASILTGSYYLVARRYNFFHSSSWLNRSVPFAFMLNFYWAKGLSQHFVAKRESYITYFDKRRDNLITYQAQINSRENK